MTDININELFGSNESSEKNISVGDIGRGSDTKALARQLGEMLDVVSDEDRTLNGFGFTEDFLTGGNNPDENSFFQNVARSVTNSNNPELSRVRSLRDGMDSAFFKDVAEALEGQGQVSNFERQAGAASINRIKDKGIDDDTAQREINRLRDAIQFRDFRESDGVTIDENGFETKDGQSVITYRGKNGQIFTQKVDKPTIYVPDWVGEEGVRDSLQSIPVGSQVYYNGNLYTKQPDN